MHFDKPIVILDEPFNGLDLEADYYWGKLLKILKDQNKIVIVTSHVLQTLFPIYEEIFWLNKGVIEVTFEQNQFSEIESEIFS